MPVPDAQQSQRPVVKLPGWVDTGAWAFVILGVLGTAVALADSGRSGRDAWAMLLVNFLFWTGLAQGLVVWTAVFRTAQAVWTPALNRLGLSAVLFPWLALLPFAALFFGRAQWLTWVREPVPEKAIWLNVPFFFGRDLLALAVMAYLGGRLARCYQRGETASPERRDAAHASVNRVATTVVIAYTLAYSLLAFDLVMSLAPRWYSSLFGAYFFVGNLYLALAGLIVMAWLLRRPLGMTELIGERQFRDMGNLLLGFGVLLSGFFFAQYLTIWYGNLPEETSFLIPRAYSHPWHHVGYLLLAFCYLGPFVALIRPWNKQNPNILGPIALVVMAGMALERWDLVMPSLEPHRLAGLAPLNWAMPLAFLGVLVLVTTISLRRNPEVSSLDRALELAEGVTL